METLRMIRQNSLDSIGHFLNNNALYQDILFSIFWMMTLLTHLPVLIWIPLAGSSREDEHDRMFHQTLLDHPQDRYIFLKTSFLNNSGVLPEKYSLCILLQKPDEHAKEKRNVFLF